MRPDWVEPMAATLTQERFSGPDWVFERKLDGIRLLAYKRGRDVSLFSRNRLIQNHSYPEVVRAGAELAVKGAILRMLPLRAPRHRVLPLEGDKPWERACGEGWEGVIAKRRGSLYEHRRS